MKALAREIAITAILALAAFFFLRATIDTVIVIGISMEPSFHSGQRLLLNKISYRLHEPERGDVIVFQPIDHGQGDFIKRIIALPGDTVEVQEESIYINGVEVREPYIQSPPRYTVERQKIPTGHYFVLGDNRNNSNDSHNGWVVPRENIAGKAWISIWPPPEWGLAPNYPLIDQLARTVDDVLARVPLYNIIR
jgi:signal peptidase I